MDEPGWENICLSFYRDSDEDAREAIGIFEQSQANDTPPNKNVNKLLDSVGLSNISLLSSEDLKKCIEIKNLARRQVHMEVIDSISKINQSFKNIHNNT